MVSIDFKKLWDIVIEQFPMDIHSIHGPRHWKQVEKNGLLLAKETGVDETIVKLFSIFHDSRRITDKRDDGHGLRGAELARMLKGQYFDLPDDSFEILIDACENHTSGRHSADITIATCWDADRLDLPRAGITPDPERMCTAPGRRLSRTLHN
jgi:uncharacterized protein